MRFTSVKIPLECLNSKHYTRDMECGYVEKCRHKGEYIVMDPGKYSADIFESIKHTDDEKHSLAQLLYSAEDIKLISYDELPDEYRSIIDRDYDEFNRENDIIK